MVLSAMPVWWPAITSVLSFYQPAIEARFPVVGFVLKKLGCNLADVLKMAWNSSHKLPKLPESKP
jgi:hypothetical protein